MPTFEPWDVVKVPFPYTDRPVREYRPALVVTSSRMREEHELAWVLMITSATHRSWPADVKVSELSQAGLPAASVVRTAKIATIEADQAVRIGALPKADREQVRERIRRILADL